MWSIPVIPVGFKKKCDNRLDNGALWCIMIHMSINWRSTVAKQAKCDECRIRFIWARSLPLDKARCVLCGSALHGTTVSCPHELRDLGRLQPLGKEKISEQPLGEACVYTTQMNKQCDKGAGIGRTVVIPWKRAV